MTKNRKFYSNLAFNLAENHLGRTGINPSVGCVVVKNNSVISSGVTDINGRPHAEFIALNKNLNFKDSDMYVTLEPCAHHGSTPPCTNIIKNKKIKNVFYNNKDPDLITRGKAEQIFKTKKINFRLVRGVRDYFYKSYFLNKRKNLPLLDAKLAISKDYNSINIKSKRITNNRSKIVTFLLRSKYDSIISTAKTINEDNALLNCRIKGLDNNKPDLLIIDRNLTLKKNLKFLQIANKRKTYIFTSSKNTKKISFFKSKKCKVIQINDLKCKNDFLNLFNIIFKLGKRRILVESGLIFLNELFKLKLVNELYLFMSNKKLGNDGLNNMYANYLRKFQLNNKIRVNLNDDKLYKIKL